MTATQPPEVASSQTQSHLSAIVGWTIAGFLLVLCVVGLITYGANQRDAASQQKAVQLQAGFRAAGLAVPVNTAMIERSLGHDGGWVCDNPANALGRAIVFDQLTNGADFVGRRPIIADTKILKGEALILKVYCPDKLQAYRDKFNDLKTDDTIKN